MIHDHTIRGLDKVKDELSTIKKILEADDENREKIIKISRDIIRPSKHAIHSLHREEYDKAKKLLDTARSSIEEAYKLIDKSQFNTVGAFGAGVEEFVEATSYYLFLTEKRLPARNDLELSFEIPQDKYLLGLCDLPGELARKAVLYAIDDNKEGVTEIYTIIEQLVEALLQFDFRTGEYRKKIESVKYQLTKVQDILYDLHIKKS
ncbi:MAG: translin family protein [Nanobdellota archaeon]